MDAKTEKLLIELLSEQLQINATVRSELDALTETLKSLDPSFQRHFEANLARISKEQSEQPASQIAALIKLELGAAR